MKKTCWNEEDKMSGNMTKTLYWALDRHWMNVLPRHCIPPFSLFFKSVCFIWTWLCVYDHSAAISARASLSRMAALRGGPLKSCPGEILAVAVCSFTLQNGLRGLQLPCGVMDNTQRQTPFYMHVHIHARELNLEISMHVHQHCKHFSFFPPQY